MTFLLYVGWIPAKKRVHQSCILCSECDFIPWPTGAVHQAETLAKKVAQLTAKEAEYVRRTAVEERQEAQQRATLLKAKNEVGRDRRLCSGTMIPGITQICCVHRTVGITIAGLSVGREDWTQSTVLDIFF